MKVFSTEYSSESGVYVAIMPTDDSKEQMNQFLTKLNPTFSLEKFNKKAHMSVVWSSEDTIDVSKLKIPDDISAMASEFVFWDGHDDSGYIVLKCICKGSSDLHEQLIGLGATHSFPDYVPHVTIVHNIEKDQVTEWIKKANKSLSANRFLITFDTIKIEDANP